MLEPQLKRGGGRGCLQPKSGALLTRGPICGTEQDVRCLPEGIVRLKMAPLLRRWSLCWCWAPFPHTGLLHTQLSSPSSCRIASPAALQALVLIVPAPKMLILNFVLCRGQSGREVFSVPFVAWAYDYYNQCLRFPTGASSSVSKHLTKTLNKLSAMSQAPDSGLPW